MTEETVNAKSDELPESNLEQSTLKLALPAIGEMLMQTLLGFADMAMVGSLGATAIAAVGLSDMPMMTSMSFFASISVGTTALVARAIGAKKQDEANNVARQSLILTIIMSAVFVVLGLSLAVPIVKLMGAEPDVVPISASYFSINAWGFPFMIITMVMNGVLRGGGDTKTPMYINGISNIVNIVGNFFLIYQSRNIDINIPFLNKNISLFIPGAGWGVDGAGIATTFSRFVGFVIIMWILVKGRRFVRIDFKEKWRFDTLVIKRIFNIGIPAAVEQFLMRFGQLLFSRIVSSLGTVTFAAHRITMTAESLSFNAGFGFALAATTLVGQYLGAEKPKLAEKSGFIAVKMGAILMAIVGVFFFIWPDYFLRIFTDDKEIIDMGRICLRVVAISQPFLAAVMGFSGALRGAGDTRRVLVITLTGIWGIRLLLTYIFVIIFKWGLIGAWIAMSIDLIVRGILYFFMFRAGKWKHIKV
ncbi:putative multidrug resistance protein norM Multidrug-efflux transporter [Proteiniborus sp. DW1]|uniref:MATE family efflux transporter n=1 Tax=Proteiniborus sp. DW1 TaxID=1889883 RepID=UPI00092E13E5|nr:MATE family efflux transporter [Proteiniborus sp. DW1]SCG83104.1 putative multidrug resistance protein norM Multidrug-efflux transporter [Proteiniborus sp. DW1]